MVTVYNWCGQDKNPPSAESWRGQRLKEQGPLMSTKLLLKQVKPSQWLRKQMRYSESEAF